MEIAEDVGAQGSPTYAYVDTVRNMVAPLSMFVKHKFGKFVLDSLPPEGIRISRMPQRKGRPPPPVSCQRGLPCTGAWRDRLLGSTVVSAATRLPDSGHVGARARCQDRGLGAAKTKHDVSDAEGDWDIGERGAALAGWCIWLERGKRKRRRGWR